MEFSEFELHDGFHVVCVGAKNCPLYCSQPYRAHDTEKEAAEVWNSRTALASGSGDHADHSGDATDMVDHAAQKDLRHCIAIASAAQPGWADVWIDALEALLAENAALRAERGQIAGESIWWKGVIGDGSHQPSGEVRSIKHMHPAMAKPIYEANKGTAVADVIAGLIFSLAITENREQFLVADANERRFEAERKLAEAEWLLREIAKGETPPEQHGHYLAHRKAVDAARTFISKEAERG